MRLVPFGYLPGPIALAGTLVERLSKLASASSRYLAVDAHVEVLAVLGVGVTRVCGCDRVVDLGAGEVEELTGTAAFLLRLVRPVADPGLFGEHQPIRAHDHVELALHAVIECVTVPGILVGEVAVHTGTVRRRLRLFCLRESANSDTE